MRDAFIAEFSELCVHDKSLILVTGDLGFGVFDQFRKDFPDQFINAGIAEQNMMGMATGLALEGFRVFTYSIGNFPTFRCLEQLRNDAIYHNANVTVVSIGAGFSYGQLGMSHHATEDLSVLRSFPFELCVPSDLNETKLITKYLASKQGTSYLRLDKSHAKFDIPEYIPPFKFGTPRKVSEGNDLSIISIGGITGECLKSVEQLKKCGINCRLIVAHSINNLNFEEIILASQQTGGIVTVEENSIHGGFGSYVIENLMELGHPPQKFYRIGMRDGFSKVVGDQDFLKKHYQLDSEAITQRIKEVLS